jgi:hypothetical protein
MPTPKLSFTQRLKIEELARLSLKLSDILTVMGFRPTEAAALMHDEAARESFQFGRKSAMEELAGVLVSESLSGNVSAARLLLAMQNDSKEEIEIKSREQYATDRIRLIEQGMKNNSRNCWTKGRSVRERMMEQRNFILEDFPD